MKATLKPVNARLRRGWQRLQVSILLLCFHRERRNQKSSRALSVPVVLGKSSVLIDKVPQRKSSVRSASVLSRKRTKVRKERIAAKLAGMDGMASRAPPPAQHA
ncbi:hypothetical protein PM082_016756 [Marasmius tenuissimus]|nr:hypothetical protein PM082_016756 [Marasmius tenuissimus]